VSPAGLTTKSEWKPRLSGFDSRSEAEIPFYGMGGATNKNKGLRQIVNPFFVSEIDY